jgi:WD40 repeat protein
VQIWDVATCDLLQNCALDNETDRSHTEGVVAVAWSPRAELVALVILDGTVRMWRIGAACAY